MRIRRNVRMIYNLLVYLKYIVMRKATSKSSTAGMRAVSKYLERANISSVGLSLFRFGYDAI